MHGSAVSTPAVVQVLGPERQPDQRQLSVGGVRAVVVDVRALCAVCVCLCVSGGRRACVVFGVHLPLCVRALHVSVHGAGRVWLFSDGCWLGAIGCEPW
jgi:hypothetical protein